jgi:hypothetical protein
MLRDNGSDSHNTHWCNGGARWPPSAGSSDVGEGRSATHRLWSLGCWSYLHPRQGHSCILTRFQKSDPTFSMGVDVMRSVYNLEPKYRVTMLAREEWTRGPGTPPVVKGFVWFTDGPRTAKGTGAGVYEHSVNRRLSISLRKIPRSFRLRYMRY